VVTKWILYWLRAPKVTFLVVVGLAAMGGWSLVTLPREATPEIDIPVGIVLTAWPGASARDVEELITKPVEKELLTLEGVDQVTSSSRLGVSTVTVEFEVKEELGEALRRLREATARVRDLPAEAERPEVVEVSFSSEPIISIGMGGPFDARLLTLYAQDLAEKLEAVAGVSAAEVIGGRQEEIKIELVPGELAAQGVSVGQVIAAIRAADVTAPFGQLTTEGFHYDLRLVGGVETVSEVAQLAVSLPNGQVVPLASLASVRLGLVETASESRIGVGGEEAQPAVTLQVRKTSGGNILRIINEVEEVIETSQKEFLPENLEITTFADQAAEIRKSLQNVTSSGVQTLVIVFALLWLFLGWRAALLTSLAIPLTFCLSFLVMVITGTTLNNISLFSLILSLGLLVDNAIVVVEGVAARGGKLGLGARAKAVVEQFSKPLMGGTLTTVAAFFPMLLVSGIIGQFLSVIPIVVAGTLLSSLLVALCFLPAVSVQLLGRWQGTGQSSKERWFDRQFARLQERYEQFLRSKLKSRVWQRWFLGGLLALLVVGLSLPFMGILRTSLFPVVNIDFLIINGELPPGSTLEQTAKVAGKVEEGMRKVPEVENFVLNLGSASSLEIGGGGSSSEALFSLFVNLKKERERTSSAITETLRGEFAEITEAKVEIAEVSAGPPSAAPIELTVVGSDLEELDALSLELREELAQIEGVVEADRNLRRSAGEFNFVIDHHLLASRGLSAAEVAQALRAAVLGVEVTSWVGAENEKVVVRVQAREAAMAGVDDVLALPLVNAKGEVTRLAEVARVEVGTSVDAIRHREGDTAVTVTAKVEEGYNAAEISRQMEDRVQERVLPAGVEVVFGGEQEETVETFAELYRSMIVAVLLIVLILVAEFNSYRQPLIIFLSIPLALIGVLFGLVLLNGELNFAAFIGLVSLTGIVVNNAIILVDRMNNQRAAGVATEEAVLEAAKSRLRPIILTTITTAAGVAPLIWVDEFFRDMALTLITGLLFSTVLTLIFIPILYWRQQELGQGGVGKWGLRVARYLGNIRS
jgi:multidrug efflux pump subunit AcrB